MLTIPCWWRKERTPLRASGAFSGSGRAAVYSCRDRAVRGDLAEYTSLVHGKPVTLTVSANVHIDENMAAVAAMVMELGLAPPRSWPRALAAYALVTQRFAIAQIGLLGPDRRHLQRANPVSMARSIREAERMAQGRRLVLVLADMRELKSESAFAHRELGRSSGTRRCCR